MRFTPRLHPDAPHLPTDPESVYGEKPKAEPYLWAPPINYPPPPLRQLGHISCKVVKCLKYAEHQNGVFKVLARIEGKEQFAILKVYHSDEPPEEMIWTTGDEMYDSESRAYANLLHYGLCDAGLVPYCFGVIYFPDWTAFPPRGQTDSDKDILAHFRRDLNPPKGLLLEYLPDMAPLSLRNLSPDVAHTVMDILMKIHQAFVFHGDVYPRNILIGPGDRVVIIDFGESRIYPEDGTTSEFMSSEYATTWEYFFWYLLPDHVRILRGERPWYHVVNKWFGQTTSREMIDEL